MIECIIFINRPTFSRLLRSNYLRPVFWYYIDLANLFARNRLYYYRQVLREVENENMIKNDNSRNDYRNT